jgi:hypothetical protein
MAVIEPAFQATAWLAELGSVETPTSNPRSVRPTTRLVFCAASGERIVSLKETTSSFRVYPNATPDMTRTLKNATAGVVLILLAKHFAGVS